MDKELINFIIVIGSVLSGIIGFIWKLSSKYSHIDMELKSVIKDKEVKERLIDILRTAVATHNNQMSVIQNTINNITSSMVLKTDITRLETEMNHLKSTIDDIKVTLRESIKTNTNQFQELSQKLGLIMGQYGEIKEYVKAIK